MHTVHDVVYTIHTAKCDTCTRPQIATLLRYFGNFQIVHGPKMGVRPTARFFLLCDAPSALKKSVLTICWPCVNLSNLTQSTRTVCHSATPMAY